MCPDVRVAIRNLSFLHLGGSELSNLKLSGYRKLIFVTAEVFLRRRENPMNCCLRIFPAQGDEENAGFGV